MTLPSSIAAANSYAQQKIDATNPDQALRAMRELMASRSSVKIWIVLLPGRDVAVYSRIKITADLTVGVSTVRHIKRGNETRPGLCSNLCLKTNLKLSRSNANHALRTPSTLLGVNTMVVGIDVVSATLAVFL